MNNLSNIFGFNSSNNKKQIRGLSQTKSGQTPIFLRGGVKKKVSFLFKEAGDPEDGPYTGVYDGMSKLLYMLFKQVKRQYEPTKVYHNEYEVYFDRDYRYDTNYINGRIKIGDVVLKFMSTKPYYNQSDDSGEEDDDDSGEEDDDESGEEDDDESGEESTLASAAAAAAPAAPAPAAVDWSPMEKLESKFLNETRGVTVFEELQSELFEFWNSRITISTNYKTAISLLEDNKVIVWGDNRHGQTKIPKFRTPVKMVSAGQDHLMALTVDGIVYTWGSNTSGQCNNPDFNGIPVDMISAGFYFSAALLSNNTIKCWGRYFGQLTVSDFKGEKATMISAGGNHMIILFSDGSIKCLGENDYGQCNVPNFMGRKAVTISACNASSGVVLDNGGVLCWGYNKYGQCNPPDKINALKMVKARKDNPVVRIIMGVYNGAALLQDRNLLCWGDKEFGLPDIPEWIQGKVVDVSINYSTVLVVVRTNEGDKIVCWGAGSSDLCDIPRSIMGTEFYSKCDCGKLKPNASLTCADCIRKKPGGYSFSQYFHHCY